MVENDSDTGEWRPEEIEDYEEGPVLTDRQAATIATLDTHSRKSTAALLGIEPSTVDTHRENGQKRAVAAIRQLQYLLTESETIQEEVKDELGRVDFTYNKRGPTPEETFPNIPEENLVDKSKIDPRLLDEPLMELDLDAFDLGMYQYPSPSSTTPTYSGILDFVLKSGEAKEIEFLDATTGTDIEELEVLHSFSLESNLKRWELIGAAEVIYKQIAESDCDYPLLRRIE